MSNHLGRRQQLIAELRNRRVFRVSIVYAGTGFVILEASDMILPRLGLPDWTITFILVLLGLGFPIAVGLAWTFQVTPEGLKRSPKSGEKPSAFFPLREYPRLIALLTKYSTPTI